MWEIIKSDSRSRKGKSFDRQKHLRSFGSIHLSSVCFSTISLTFLSKVPSLKSFAASKLMELEISGEASMLIIISRTSATFLLGIHSFSPSMSLQISPSLMFGW